MRFELSVADPLWDILIVSVTERRASLAAMLTSLIPMIEPHDGHVVVSVYVDDFDLPRHAARNLLVQSSTAGYTSFVDDDDRLPPYFCDRVVPLLGEVDYVGWRMQCIWAGEQLKPTFHSLRYPAWSDDAAGYYRHISHLNPIRRTLAAQVPFPAVAAEDYHWALAVHALGIVRTEAFIDDCMYFYEYDPATSLVSEANRTHARPEIELPTHDLISMVGT